ncbi:hypothetical protein PS880_06069 [Pseudomonas fluorescens]|uniref:Uncharacterized protein n=1 Tax=Pseudomonas fluorescens TaxID=294 RepID=A0A5E7QES3_PSEFL|nr:hypothetical protein PS880_06069 [Pseudomonas fluorescens]
MLYHCIKLEFGQVDLLVSREIPNAQALCEQFGIYQVSIQGLTVRIGVALFVPAGQIEATYPFFSGHNTLHLIDVILLFSHPFFATDCSGLMKPDTHLGENARQIEVSDDQTTPFLFC